MQRRVASETAHQSYNYLINPSICLQLARLIRTCSQHVKHNTGTRSREGEECQIQKDHKNSVIHSGFDQRLSKFKPRSIESWTKCHRLPVFITGGSQCPRGVIGGGGDCTIQKCELITKRQLMNRTCIQFINATAIGH